jgi:hypothetical protein
MRIALLSLALAAFTALPAQVVINEFVYDDSGTDDREFVELYNAGPAAVDLSNWVLEGLDEAYPSDNNADYTLPVGATIAPGGFYTIGSSNLPVDFAVGATNLWENGGTTGGESIVLRDATGAVIDAVTYESNKHLSIAAAYPTQFSEGDGIYGNMTSIDGSSQSWARYFDGLDTNDNGRDFGLLPLTLGASNVIATNLIPFVDDFNSQAVGTPVSGFLGSFVTPFVEDPNAVNLPNALGTSPDGGNVMVCWDPAGGGNSASLVSVPTDEFEVECFAYFYAGHSGTDVESWSIGVRGTAATFYNLPILFPSNGNTGLAWVYVTDSSGGNLYLVDELSGGDDGPENILLSIPVTAGVNDGWQRLRLKVSNCVVEANFGGTFGDPSDGVAFSGFTRTSRRVGSFYLGYREGVSGVTNARPLALDRLQVFAPAQPSFSLCLSQPGGAGSLLLENNGLAAGDDVTNVFTFNEPCPGGVGTGPFAGLCTANPLALFDQLLIPLGTPPFHYLATGPFYSFSLPAGLPANLRIEGVAVKVSGLGVDLSPVAWVVTL